MKRIFFLFVELLCVFSVFAQVKVVAHRGYWDVDGSAQNSIRALEMAAEIGCYGSEFDVNITSDGVVVVNHDATINGIRIEDNPYSAIKDVKLKNGEFLPTLAQYLECGSKFPDMQLIFEIKGHKLPENEDRCVDASVAMVKSMGLQERVEWISFSMRVCERIHQLLPKAKVAYLSGNESPLAIKERGLTGIDYNEGVIKKHTEWLDEAHQNQVEVNVWTVDGEEDLTNFANDSRIDIITTNKQVLLQKILEQKNQ